MIIKRNMSELLIELGILGKFALSLFLGLAIGTERELAGKPAGIRTYMEVTASSTLLSILGVEIVLYFNKVVGEDLSVDPTRVIQAIAVGLSFMGAGVILHDAKHNRVENLTTAAGLLVAASIGIAVAIERYYLSIGATLLVLFVTRVLVYYKKWLHENVAMRDPSLDDK